MSANSPESEESVEEMEELDVASVHSALLNSEKVDMPYSADYYVSMYYLRDHPE